MDICHGDREQPRPESEPGCSSSRNSHNNCRKRKKGLPEDELKLLKDLSGFPHLASMLHAQSVLKTRMTSPDKNAVDIGNQLQEICKEQQENPRLLKSLANIRQWMEEEIENSSGDNEEIKVGNKKRRRRRKSLPEDEVKLLKDMSEFPYLAAMLQAHAAVREGKALKAVKMSGHVMNLCEEGSQPQTIGDTSRENCGEDAYTLEVIYLPSASPEKDAAVDFGNHQTIGELISASGDLNAEELQEKSRPNECDRSEYGLLPLPEDILPMKLLVDCGNKDKSRESSRSVSNQSKAAVTEEDVVLRKLLRRQRYFDLGEDNFHTGRPAFKSHRNRRKPCYVCGDMQHAGRKCRKRRTCFVCNGRGHLAEQCPKSSQEFNICLKCGESGHELFSCNNDYPPDDLKNIVCYVCNEGGHICCSSYTNISPDTVSCFNCGESGHSGPQCPKPHMDKKTSRPPSICYKCGDTGHAARKCRVPVQIKHRQSKDGSTKSTGD